MSRISRNKSMEEQTDKGLSMVMVKEFIDKVDKGNNLIATALEKLSAIEEHLVRLNGAVAKHNDWIARYDIRVEKEVPELALIVKDNDKKIYAFGVTMTIVNIVIGTTIAILSAVWKIIKG